MSSTVPSSGSGCCSGWPRTSTELGFVESSPKQDGRNMIMVLGPHKKKSEAKAEVKAEQGRAGRRARRPSARRSTRERTATAPTAPGADKKPRRRSENLDPDM